MTCTITVWQVCYDNKALHSTYETKQMAIQKADEINEGGKTLVYVREVKVCGKNKITIL